MCRSPARFRLVCLLSSLASAIVLFPGRIRYDVDLQAARKADRAIHLRLLGIPRKYQNAFQKP